MKTDNILRLIARHKELSPLIILIVVIVGFSIGNANFVSQLNVSNLLSFLPEIGIIALGMTLLLTAGEFDLSVGAVFALIPITVLLLVNNAEIPLGFAIIISLATAVGIGLVNGILVTKEGITSFLVTLSTLLIAKGVALLITNGFPQTPLEGDHLLVSLLVGKIYFVGFAIHASVLWFAALAIFCHFLLSRSRFGNWVVATGSNKAAASARGVPIDRVKIILFAFAAFLSGFAGLLSALRIRSASPVAGTGYELEVIAMVVVGGTALAGGRGTIIGTVLGVLLLRLIRNGIIMMGVPGLAYNIFVGIIILGMLIIHARLERVAKLR